jgi:alkylation response protein AidB-like acyl-CoA dehydrogenase
MKPHQLPTNVCLEESVMTTPAGLPTEMRDAVVQTLRQVVARDLPDEKSLDLDKKDMFPLELIQKLLSPEVGLHLIFLPESVGGLGGGARDICEISEEMAVHDLGVATAFLAICLGTDPIIVGGTEAQKSHWLTRIATGGLIVAYGVTEPEAGSNVAALKTTAEPITDAAGAVLGYRLNGTKQFITNGGVAQIYTILAKTPAGPSFFVVERNTDGLSVGKKEEKHGIRASNTTGLVLEDVEIPVDNLIGGVEGQGLKQANAVFGYTRLMVGAFGLGTGQSAVNRALAYGKAREQFGAPLVEKHTEAGIRATDAALQALGGYGYAREYMVEKYRRDVRITSIYEGTSEIQQSIIAMYRWKETVRSRGEFYTGGAADLDAIHTANDQVAAALAAASLRGLNDLILHVHQTKQTLNQNVMFTLADLITKCEVAGALVRKAARLAAEDDRKAALFAAMSRVFARQAAATMREGVRPLVSGFAPLGDARATAAAEALTTVITDRFAPDDLAGLWTDMVAVGQQLKEMD